EPGMTPEKAQEKAASQTEKAWAKDATFTPTRGPKAHKPSTPTIEAISKEWKDLVEKDTDLAPATISMHTGNVDNHILPAFEKMTPPDLSTGVLRRWIRGLREKYQPSTVRNIYNTLGKMIDDAMAEEWVDLAANPLRHPKVRDELPTVEAPEPED